MTGHADAKADAVDDVARTNRRRVARSIAMLRLGRSAMNGSAANAAGRRLPFRLPTESRLEMAVFADDAAAIGEALRCGADVDAADRYRMTLLMKAVHLQKVNAVEALLRACANPNAMALDGQTPVTLAVDQYLAPPDGRRILVAVLEGGGDANARYPDGDPVIMQFVRDHSKSGLALMKAMGADLDIRDRAGHPLITKVALAQDWAMAWALAELGAEVAPQHAKSDLVLSKALSLRRTPPDTPLYTYKLKFWQLLKDKGLPVQPLDP